MFLTFRACKGSLGFRLCTTCRWAGCKDKCLIRVTSSPSINTSVKSWVFFILLAYACEAVIFLFGLRVSHCSRYVCCPSSLRLSSADTLHEPLFVSFLYVSMILFSLSTFQAACFCWRCSLVVRLQQLPASPLSWRVVWIHVRVYVVP
jgi:hypothetical protein